MGAWVAASWFWGVAVRVPALRPARVSTISSPPKGDNASNNSPEVILWGLGNSFWSKMSPVSIPMSIFMVVTPVTASPFNTDH